MRIRLLLAPLFLTGVAFTAAGQDRAGPNVGANADANAKIQVQARGPIHEAFAQPWEKNPQASEIIKKKPPEPIAEEPPDQKPVGNNVHWIPGYWAFDPGAKDYLWVSGMWRNVPDHRHWVMGYWTEADGGFRWVHGHWAADGEQDVHIVPTPPESQENGPSSPAPDASSFYIPGSWFYTDQGYRWRGGYWSDVRDGYTWNPASYYWTPGGYAFSNGYWDYSPLNRGLMFAPVSFADQSYLGSNFLYRPSYALSPTGMMDNMFVNSGLGSYFFGNYYGSNYSGLGYTPWLGYGANAYDPLYNYLRYSGTNTSLGGLTMAALQSNLQSRLSGQLAAPPVTLADQLRLAAAANPGGATVGTTARNTLLTSLANLATGGSTSANANAGTALGFNNLRFQPLTPDARATYRQNVQQMINRSVELNRMNSALRTSGYAVPRIGAAGNVQGGANVPGVNIPGTNIPGVHIPGVNTGVNGQMHIPGVNTGVSGQGNVPGTTTPGVNVPGVHIPGVNTGVNGQGGVQINPGGFFPNQGGWIPQGNPGRGGRRGDRR